MNLFKKTKQHQIFNGSTKHFGIQKKHVHAKFLMYKKRRKGNSSPYQQHHTENVFISIGLDVNYQKYYQVLTINEIEVMFSSEI